jgi:hypothetical protein
MSRLILGLAGAVAVLVFLGEEVRAQAPAPSAVPGRHVHDGFFIRFTPGLGGAASAEQVGGDDVSISGGGFVGSLAIGGAIQPGVILCIETHAITTRNPSFNVNNDSVRLDGSSYWVQYIGGAITYYTASNVYLHGGFGAIWASFQGESGGRTVTTDAGLGAKGALGKEWWVSDNWGLGIAGTLLIGSSNDGGEQMTSAVVGLNFSATFN